jgi:hypothetical protein
MRHDESLNDAGNLAFRMAKRPDPELVAQLTDFCNPGLAIA